MSDDTGQDERDEGLDDEMPELDEADEQAVRALLKRSLDLGAQAEGTPTDAALVRGFQERMRKRSKGKFYRDGWSTTQSRVSVALVATFMLLMAVVVFLAMGPVGISP